MVGDSWELMVVFRCWRCESMTDALCFSIVGVS